MTKLLKQVKSNTEIKKAIKTKRRKIKKAIKSVKTVSKKCKSK